MTDQAVPQAPRSWARWSIVFLLFLAMTLNYLDRQMIAVLKPLLSHDFHWSEADYANIITAFQGAYAASYFLLGRLVDRFGAKVGFAVAFAIWSIAQIAHGFARSLSGFMAARILLGLGEGGAYPAGLTAVAQWFPKSERAFATGIFNAGVLVGAVVTPLIVPALVLRFGWRAAFVLTGIISFVWLLGWLFAYRTPGAARLEKNEAVVQFHWSEILRRKEAWAYGIAKFIIDPIFWMFLFWLPDFFAKRYGLDLKSFGPPLVVIYILADLGSFAGGWLSSHLIRRGLSTNDARKTAMLACALLATPVVVRRTGADLMDCGRHCRSGCGGASGLLGQSLHVSVRRLSATCGGLGHRLWRHVGRDRRHADRAIHGLGVRDLPHIRANFRVGSIVLSGGAPRDPSAVAENGPSRIIASVTSAGVVQRTGEPDALLIGKNPRERRSSSPLGNMGLMLNTRVRSA